MLVVVLVPPAVDQRVPEAERRFDKAGSHGRKVENVEHKDMKKTKLENELGEGDADALDDKEKGGQGVENSSITIVARGVPPNSALIETLSSPFGKRRLGIAGVPPSWAMPVWPWKRAFSW